MHTLSSLDEVQRLLQDRPERTHTYQLTSELARKIPLDAARLRRMDDTEVRELASYLDVNEDQLKGPFRVVNADCPHCGRRITFLDFAKTAIDDGAHDAAMLTAILTGQTGNWITIRGRDGGRPVRCANCNQLLRMPNGSGGSYSEYTSSNYAYA